MTRIQTVASIDTMIHVDGWRIRVTAQQYALDPFGSAYRFSVLVAAP